MVDQMLNNRDSHLINGISNLDLNLSLSIVKKVIFDTDRADTEVSFHWLTVLFLRPTIFRALQIVNSWWKHFSSGHFYRIFYQTFLTADEVNKSKYV